MPEISFISLSNVVPGITFITLIRNVQIMSFSKNGTVLLVIHDRFRPFFFVYLKDLYFWVFDSKKEWNSFLILLITVRLIFYPWTGWISSIDSVFSRTNNDDCIRFIMALIMKGRSFEPVFWGSKNSLYIEFSNSCFSQLNVFEKLLNQLCSIGLAFENGVSD